MCCVVDWVSSFLYNMNTTGMPYLGGWGLFAVLFGALFLSNYFINVFRNPFPGLFLHSLVKINTCISYSNKIQQDATVYRCLFTANPSTCLGCPSHPSSGVHKTVTAASGTGHSIWATAFLQRCSNTMTCTKGCSYSFMYSWWWVRWTPETCRVILQ